MARPTILAVDDDPQVVRAIVRDLRSRYGEDHRIVRATSGAEALEMLAELILRDRGVALVVADQRMPGMTGIEMMARVRESSPGTRLLLLTAYADTDVAIRAINDIGLDYYMVKPWEPPETQLYPVVDDLLEAWRQDHPEDESVVRVVGHLWSDRGHDVKMFLARNHIPYRWLDVAVDEEARRLVHLAEAEPGELPPRPPARGGHAARPDECRARRGARAADPRRADALRPVHRRRRPGRAGRGGLRRVGGPAHRHRRARRPRRPGRPERGDRELPRLPQGRLGRRPHAPGGRAGVAVRRGDRARPGGRGARAARARCTPSGSAAEARSRAGPCSWRPASPTGGSRPRAWTPSGREGSTTAPRRARRPRPPGEVVYVVGAANSAGQAVLNFAKVASRVVMVVRAARLEDSMSEYLVARIRAAENVEVRFRSEVVAARGTDHLEAVTVVDRDTGVEHEEPTNWLFVFIGALPRTDWLGDAVTRDAKGFVVTGPDLQGPDRPDRWPLPRAPYALETSIPGVFAAGDVRLDSMKRVASAVGEGAMSVYLVHRYLATV